MEPPRCSPVPDPAHRARKSAMRALQVFENTLPPVEFLRQIEIETAAGNDLLAATLAESRTARDLKACTQLQPFSAQPVSVAATLYAGVGPTATRRLLVAFCGKHGRLMMPMPLLLQVIDARTWDVLALRDPTTLQFRSGCRGLAATFPELARWLATKAQDYAAMSALGASMGGYPAIRLALAVPGIRGVSVGGRPVTDAPRLVARQPTLTAFDPICACLAPVARDLIFVCSSAQEVDLDAASSAAALTKGTLCQISGSADHNVLWSLYEAGHLPRFLKTVLDSGKTPAEIARAVAPMLWLRLTLLGLRSATLSLPRRVLGKLVRIARRVLMTSPGPGADHL